MLIIAHRGASGYYKENTIRAFKGALDLGAKYFETDVQLSKDNQLVIYHDYQLDTTDKPHIKDLTYKQLKGYDVPLLSEVLSVLKDPQISINLEIKNDNDLYPNIEEKIMRELNSNKNAHKERILISSFDLPTLERVRVLDKDIKIGRLTRAFDINEALALKTYSVNISDKRVTQEVISACHLHGIKVLVYTVNDYAETLRLKEMGADGIFSDYPDIMNKK